MLRAFCTTRSKRLPPHRLTPIICASYTTGDVILIHTQHLYKSGEGRRLLEDISLEIPASTVFGVLGRNGAGKSLLLKCMAGLVQPSKGIISSERPVRQSYAFQSAGLAPELTVGENLQLFAAIGRVPGKRRTNRVAQVMQSLSLTPYKGVRVDRLSPGVACKAEIARAMVADSQITYLDGLIDNLDNKSAEEVWRVVLARRRTEGTTFVIATTRAEVADRCDTVALMHEGRVVAMGTPALLKSEVQSDAILIDAIRNPLIKSKIKKQFAVAVEQADGMLKIRSAETLGTVLNLLADYGSEVGAVYLKQPGLYDVLDKAIEGKKRNA